MMLAVSGGARYDVATSKSDQSVVHLLQAYL
jgi:hypothetical protein